jgi:hypothetical protein
MSVAAVQASRSALLEAPAWPIRLSMYHDPSLSVKAEMTKTVLCVVFALWLIRFAISCVSALVYFAGVQIEDGLAFAASRIRGRRL